MNATTSTAYGVHTIEHHLAQKQHSTNSRVNTQSARKRTVNPKKDKPGKQRTDMQVSMNNPSNNSHHQSPCERLFSFPVVSATQQTSDGFVSSAFSRGIRKHHLVVEMGWDAAVWLDVALHK